MHSPRNDLQSIENRVAMKAVQDYYPENVVQCDGCGVHNERRHRTKTCREGAESVTRYTLVPFHGARYSNSPR